MKIDPDILRRLRKEKDLSRAQLERRSNVSKRTIQRLENESERTQTNREDTLDHLAKALGVEKGVLTGDMPFPDANKSPEPERVQIGAQVAPKARLAYDLVKRRYGVSATEIINMAPLFFTLLAEESLAKRLENLKEVSEAIGRLDEIGEAIGHPIFGDAAIVAGNARGAEEDSIDKADIFGEHLLGDDVDAFFSTPFEPATDNPFAGHLRRLAADLDRPGIVKVERDDLSYGTPWLRFPDYELCDNQLNGITNGSRDAKRALETGYARLSDIPENLKGEETGEERAAWLAERLPDTFKDLEEDQPMAKFLDGSWATTPPDELEDTLKKVRAAREREGDGQ